MNITIDDRIKKLEEIKKEVSCPIGAMSIEGIEIICNCPIAMYKKFNKVSLGNIRKDIVKNCTDCKLKLQKKQDDKYEELIKLQKINEFNEVACPADNKNVNAQETCLGCAFFNADKLKEMIKKGGEDEEISHIPCNYPNLSPNSLKVFLAKKVKKKSAKVAEKVTEDF